MRSFTGRAELLRILDQAPESFEYAAEVMGYERVRRADEPKGVVISSSGTSQVSMQAKTPATKPPTPILYWHLVEYEQTRLAEGHETNKPVRVTEWRGLATEAPPAQPLCPWPALMPRLRAALAEPVLHRDPDIPAIVRLISNGQPIIRWPRKSRKRWPKQLRVLEDFATRLTPLWTDQKHVTGAVRNLLPRGKLDLTRLADGLNCGTYLGNIPDSTDYVGLTGNTILVISDFGLLGHNPDASLRRWMRFALERETEGRRCVALTPAPPAAYPHEFRKAWTVVQWEDRHAEILPDEDKRKAEAERLLGLLSYAVKTPPGLLRDVRHLFPELSVIAEIDAWRSEAVASPHISAATLANKSKQDLHRHFRSASPELRREIFRLIKHWCGGEGNSIYFEAIVALGALTVETDDGDDAPRIVSKADRDAAIAFFNNINAVWKDEPVPVGLRNITKERIEQYWPDLRERTQDAAQEIPELRRDYFELSQAVTQNQRDATLPEQFDPSAFGPGGERHIVDLMQEGDKVVAMSLGSRDEKRPHGAGSLLSSIATHNDKFTVVSPFWKSGAPPSWAADYGTDEFGPWATFAVTGADGAPVTQRMRWIAPGRFMMGSPEDEPGRYGADEYEGRYNEGPQHDVRLSQGYWLFDTPVTQALWTAVMGDNPSRFKDPKRPVEQVSWDDAAKFLERLNGLIPELDLVLPTEAQWEYACRAGTATATYAGPIEILGHNNAPVLDEIAWYGGNSGVEFELAEGEDSSDWAEKQYEYNRAGTRQVGLKAPNAWGLHDMLGNVWEWCADGIREYSSEAVVDPAGPLDSTKRALRGGSWIFSARDVRAANRLALHRESQWVSTGFRCARVRAGAEPAEPGPGRAERETAPDRRGGAKPLELNGGGGKTSVELPKGRAFVVRSDCETLTFAPLTRPDWASAMGRDRYGLWTEFTLGEVAQRMRWIGPGRFMMGSPEDEPGRYDREGPQHEVRLTKGFWLFDTPVTQALWTGVMGDNPSHFKDPKRPVERVSWDNATQFMEQINGLIPELDLVLPTEAQWEYACRAGTDTATYVGPIEILGENNAPVLDGIAWYGGNSGVDFELEEGENSSRWSEKQYEHKLAGTHPVGLKLPNDWGLYDMLGNVREWCSDYRHEYSSEAATDPVGSLDSTRRALRGGSWFYYARDVRAAYRLANLRERRLSLVGFRCARVRS